MAQHTRRRFLEIAGLLGGGVLLNTTLGSRPALAAPPGGDPDGLLLAVYFNGGWDQLMLFDPRDHTDPRFSTTDGIAASGIQTAYNLITDSGVRAVMDATGGRGIQQRGNLVFGPAVPEAFMQHYQDLAVIRGIDMETLTHEVGRRYLITGKFPRGLAAAGSSVGTVVASAHGETRNIPRLAIASEAYNEGHAAYASPIQVNVPSDMLRVLRPEGRALPAASQSLLNDFQSLPGCEAATLDASGQASLYLASRQKANLITQSGDFDLFNFSRNPLLPEVQTLFSALNISSSEINGVKGRAALAGQALATGYAQAVSLQLEGGLDDHFASWTSNHAQRLRPALEALGNLITFLKGTEYQGSGASVWSKTTLLVFSEFSRTPRLNASGGRDHHLAASCVVAGPSIRGNLSYGATSDRQQAVEFVDVDTGAPTQDASKARRIRPAEVHHTLLHSMGLDTSHLSNQSPVLLTGLLR